MDMQVKLLRNYEGPEVDHVAEPGEVIELPDAHALIQIAAGNAERVDEGTDEEADDVPQD